MVANLEALAAQTGYGLEQHETVDNAHWRYILTCWFLCLLLRSYVNLHKPLPALASH